MDTAYFPSAGLTPQAQSPLPSLAGKRVLIAEDVDINRELICLILGETDVVIDEAPNGERAVELAMQNRYDVILMDMQMPVMNGIEATRRIRRLEGPSSHTVILGLTANVMAEHIASCREVGMDGHIAKPFTPSHLITAVSNAIRAH